MCKTKCNCAYRIKEDVMDGKKVYYPEYANRLFPWRWKRLDIVTHNINTGEEILIYFKDKTVAQNWLNQF